MYSSTRWFATIGGVIAVVTALALINQDLLEHGKVSLDHVITVPLMALAIITSHLAIHAYVGRNWIVFGPLALTFALCTALILYASVGRQAAIKIDSESQAAEAMDDRTQRKEDIKKARDRLTEAEWMRDWEAAGRPKKRGRPNMQGRPTAKVGCGVNCKQWARRAEEVKSHIEILEGKLSTIAAPKEVHPQARKAADIVALFGGDRAYWKMVFVTLAELAMALCFEIASVVLFAIAWAPSPPPARRHDLPEIPDVETNDSDGVVDWVSAYRERNGGRSPTAQQIATAFAISRTTAWRRLKQAG